MIEVMAPDLIKQVDDHAECEWLLTHLSDFEAKVLWDREALGIPLKMIARREGLSAGRISQIVSESLALLRVA